MRFQYLKFLSAGLFAALASSAQALEINFAAIAINQEGDRTHIELPLSENVGFGTVTESNPNRIILNFPQATVDVASGFQMQGAGAVVSSRFEMDEQGLAHVILNLNTQAVVTAMNFEPMLNGKPQRLVLELQANAQPLAMNLEPPAATASPPEISATPQADATVIASITPAPPPEQQQAEAPAKKHVIVIDPGHGGIDPGAVSPGGVKEKDVVLAYAKALRKSLEATGHFEVFFTRGGDKFVKLEDRVKLARDQQAELFIALHADTLSDEDVHGTTFYTVSDEASDEEADRLAKKENGVDKIIGVNVSKQKQQVVSALMNLAQRESRAEALLFAQKAAVSVAPVTELTSKPLRAAAFVVLKAPDVPSVLVELGYLSNGQDETRLTSAKWREQLANAMARAVDAHFQPTTASAQ